MSSTSPATAGGPVKSPLETLYVIRSLLDGRVMDILHASREAGTPVITWPEKGTDGENQQWRFVPAEPGWWFLETVLGTGFVMTLDPERTNTEPPIVMAPKDVDGLDGQLWSLVPTEQLGYWYIQSKLATYVMDIARARRADGAPIIGFDRKYVGFENQAWAFAPVH